MPPPGDALDSDFDPDWFLTDEQRREVPRARSREMPHSLRCIVVLQCSTAVHRSTAEAGASIRAAWEEDALS